MSIGRVRMVIKQAMFQYMSTLTCISLFYSITNLASEARARTAHMWHVRGVCDIVIWFLPTVLYCRGGPKANGNIMATLLIMRGLYSTIGLEIEYNFIVH